MREVRAESRAGLHVPSINPFRAVAQLGRAPGSGKVSADFASNSPFSLVIEQR